MLNKLLKLCEEVKDSAECVEKYFDMLNLMQIYSPIFLALLGHKISENKIDPIELEIIPTEIRDLAVSSLLKANDKAIQMQLDKYWVKRAVFVLSKYQNCSVPLSDTNQGLINGRGENLLSPKGEKVLNILNQALQKGILTKKVVRLAQKAAHKFYMDIDLYKKWDISAKSLLYPLILSENYEKIGDVYPIIQLTKGCLNNCSHCLMRATPNLTHMPYPMFLSLHNHLWKTYKKIPVLNGKEFGFSEDVFFGKFFFDSDSLSYHDDIVGVDAGDVFIRSFYNCIPISIMTKGVNTLTSQKALFKMVNKTVISLSFVDTPHENMDKNIRQLNETLDLLEKWGVKKELIKLSHLQLKSGAQVDKAIFRDFSVEDVEIYRAGRAKDFKESELLLLEDKAFTPQIVVEPSGSIQFVYFENGEAIYKTLGSLLQKRYMRRGSYLDWRKKLQSERQKI